MAQHGCRGEGISPQKELIGRREWQPRGQPEPVKTYDFIDPDLGKAIPYGIYDLGRNRGWVAVGTDHDTASFAVAAQAGGGVTASEPTPMPAVLAERIHDGRLLRLVSHMLRAGYLEDWRWNATLRGAPQGGVASPILSNIYLDRLDKFVEQQLLPAYSRGRLRRPNPAYKQVEYAIARARQHGDREAVRALRRRRRNLPSQDPNDPDYRRLRYVRYADDWLLGFAGPRWEAEAIKSTIGTFLRDELKLELSDSKTLITHATTAAARFLGYEIKAQHADDKLDRRGQRAANAAIALFVPKTVIGQRCALYLRVSSSGRG